MTKPFLKWAGGKTQLLPHITQLWPSDFKTYFEPFVGGGSVFLRFQPAPSVLGDLNEDLINCYEQVRDAAWPLIKKFGAIEREYIRQSEARRADYYYDSRARFVAGRSSPLTMAALFLFLNRTSFNGLWRVNRLGEFNVPHGTPRFTKWDRTCLIDSSYLLEASEALRGARLVSGDYRVTLRSVRKGDLVYLDPPYSVAGTEQFNHYQRGGFPLEAQEEVADAAKKCMSRGAHVIVSNASDPDIQRLFEDRGFETTIVPARRSINSTGANRGGHKEAIFVSPSIARLGRAGTLFEA